MPGRQWAARQPSGQVARRHPLDPSQPEALALPHWCRSLSHHHHRCPPRPRPPASRPPPEVNLVNLERVGFNLRNFDMVRWW